MRELFTDLAGNEKLRRRLGYDAENATLSHAYILEGPMGSGKHTLALRIAASLACEHRTDSSYSLPCLTCPSCRKILSGNSPDITWIGRGDKATLGVESIRNLKQDLSVAPNELDTRVFIIEDAHLMTVQAQNAFLLSLEEPPSYVLFLLLAETAAPLLETIRSRAPLLRMEPVGHDALSDYLLKNVPEAAAIERRDKREFEELLVASEGSIGHAKLLLDSTERKALLERREGARNFVGLCKLAHPASEAVAYFSSLGQKREELTARLNSILLCLRDLLVCKTDESAPLCFFSDREEATDLSYQFTSPELLNIIDAVNDAIEQFRMNANVRLTLCRLGVKCGLL